MTGIITQADLRRAEIEDSELEGINSFVEQYEEMLIGVTVRELPDGRCAVRFCTSWCTTDEALGELEKLLDGME